MVPESHILVKQFPADWSQFTSPTVGGVHGPSEIRNLDVSLRIEQQVLRLDISVDDLETQTMTRLEMKSNSGPYLLTVTVGESVGHLFDVAS